VPASWPRRSDWRPSTPSSAAASHPGSGLFTRDELATTGVELKVQAREI